ncbi:hypothetical protein [Duganella sp. P38]|uniref:hypothetical protein n=1 Tax=Duganella sp. P38 TaxID=3423949 RepID=UPI003D797225
MSENLIENANFHHTPSTGKPWQVSMLRRRENRRRHGIGHSSYAPVSARTLMCIKPDDLYFE